MLEKRSKNKSIFFLKVIISLVNNKNITLYYRRTEGRRVIEHKNIIRRKRVWMTERVLEVLELEGILSRRHYYITMLSLYQFFMKVLIKMTCLKF